MDLWPKKLVTIVTESSLESELTRRFAEWNVRGFTITDARGQGSRGVRNANWDQAANIRIEVVTDPRTAEALCLRLKDEYYENYAMVIFVSDVATLRSDKF
jgi:hypothetical protein